MTRAALLLALAAASALAEPQEVGGVLKGDTTWEGTIVLLEDVVVPRGVTLTIEPGTTVVPSQRVRGDGPGWNPRALEIHVLGRILARGRAEQPIRLGATEGTAPAQRTALWLGLVFLPGREETSELRWCSIENARAGLQVAERRLRAESCTFRSCESGVATVLRADPVTLGVRLPAESVPVLESCLFHDCEVGVSTEAHARPDIERCVFLDCEQGIACSGYGDRVYPLHGVGARVERCEFLRCGVAVSGGSRVTNCIFEGNKIALVPSASHDHCMIVIDRYLRSHNLYWGNETLVLGDVPVGAGAVHEQPRRSGTLPEGDAAQRHGLEPSALAAILRLEEGSPGRGAAEDGGDVGAFGERGAMVGARIRPVIPGLVLDAWLMCGPPDAEASRAPAWRNRRPRPGDALDGALWVLVEGAMRPARAPGRKLLAEPGVARTLVAYVTSETEQRATLGFSVDGEVAAWWNGAEALPAQQCRFATEVTRDVLLKEGTNALVLLVAPAAERARLRVRLQDESLGAPKGAKCAKPETKSRALRIASIRPVKADTDREFRIEVKFSGPVHWEDAILTANYRLVDGASKQIPSPIRKIVYVPESRMVVLEGFNPVSKGPYLLKLGAFRDEFGVRRAVVESPTRITFK